MPGGKLINAQEVVHPFEPVWNTDSRVLILGTLPSRVSRTNGFYYGHPQNRFWKVLAAMLDETEPAGNNSRRDFLLRHRIALWDVLKSCRIEGSADSSIRQAVPNDLGLILKNAPVREIFANGQTAARLYETCCGPDIGRPCVVLPSTSPANGRYTLADLCGAWAPVVRALAEDD